MALIKLERNWGVPGWLRVWVALIHQVRRELRGCRFGGWLKVWEALIKLDGNSGGPGVWTCWVTGFGVSGLGRVSVFRAGLLGFGRGFRSWVP